MGFDAATMVRAMGIAYGQMCGTMQAHTEGSILLGLQVGFNARNALFACDLAARGVPGVEHVLEGPFGYYRLFEGAHDATVIREAPGRVWRVTELSHKPFPAGRATHGIIDARFALRAGRGSSRRRRAGHRVRAVAGAAFVSRPIIELPEPGMRACARTPGPVRFCAARSSSKISAPAVTDPATHAWRGLEMNLDDNPDPNALGPVTVSVELRGRRQRHELRVDHMYGSPARPMSRDAHLAKFRRNWVSGATRLDEADGERLSQLVDGVEALGDVRELAELTRSKGA